MAKKVLLVDLGNVLVKIGGKEFFDHLKPGKREQFIDLIHRHDKDEFDLPEFYKASIDLFEPIFFADFAALYANCFREANKKMFAALLRLKETERARLICVTDINQFIFGIFALRFPEFFEIFQQWVLSYKLRSLKSEKKPFLFASQCFHFSLKDAAFVDDRADNHSAFVECGGNKNASFLYKIDDPKNHRKFEKFLDKHFPA